jgi:hypothetical protein
MLYALVDYFSRTAKSAAVAVYSAPEKLSDANTRWEEKLRIENILKLRLFYCLSLRGIIK